MARRALVGAFYLGGAGAPAGRGGACPGFGNEAHPVLIEAAIAPSNIIVINFFFIAVMFL
ncbi:hypothetical protein [Mucilaginibacter sp. HD30]